MMQALLNGMISGLLIALPAIALSLSYGILNFANFSVGAMITTGAYLAYSLNALVGAPIVLATAIAAAALALIAIGIDHGIYRRLGRADHITLLVASMGVAFVLENVIRFCFGADVRTLDVAVARPVLWHGLRVNHEQLIILGTTLTAVASIAFVLMRTRLGRAMRAIADDGDLAEVRGIRRNRVVDWTWAISGALTALAGVLIALDGIVDPLIGMNYLVSIFAAVVVGGIGNPFGAVAGALVIGIVEETSALAVSTTYRQGISFIVLIVALLVRPQGLFGAARIRR